MEQLSKEMKSQNEHWRGFCGCLCTVAGVALGFIPLEKGSLTGGNWTC